MDERMSLVTILNPVTPASTMTSSTRPSSAPPTSHASTRFSSALLSTGPTPASTAYRTSPEFAIESRPFRVGEYTSPLSTGACKAGITANSSRRAHSNGDDASSDVAEEEAFPAPGTADTGASAASSGQVNSTIECMNPSCQFRPVPPAVETNFRTCILDHFGRNKVETVLMKRKIVYCRRCYQHASYRKNVWPEEKCDLIIDMLHINCIDEGCLSAELDHSNNREECTNRCEVRYDITMRAGELERLKILNKDYHGDVDAYIGSADDSDAELKQYAPETRGDKTIGIKDDGHSRWKRQQKSFIHTPIQVLKDFSDRFVGRNKTRAECIAAVDWCRARFEADEIDDIPRFEFVIQCPRIKQEIADRRAGRKTTKRQRAEPKAKTATEKVDDGELSETDNAASSAPKRAKTAGSNPFTPINRRRSKRGTADDDSSEEDVASTYTSRSKTMSSPMEPAAPPPSESGETPTTPSSRSAARKPRAKRA